MQTGIFCGFGYPLPARELFTQIAEAGFRNTSLWWGSQYAHVDAPKEALPELARSAGLAVENVHVDFEGANALWLDALEADSIVDRYHQGVLDCARYGIPVIVLHLTVGETPPEPNALGIARLARLVEAAERENVYIALENLRRTDFLSYVFSRIDSDHLKFCYDSGHENCFTKKGDLLDLFGDKLVSLHLHDNDGTEDQHTLPGKGTIVWKQVAEKLKQLHYSGSFSLEVTPLFFEDLRPEAFLREAFQRANEIARMCCDAHYA